MGHESQSPEEHQRRLAEQQAARRRAAEAQRREEAKRKAEEEAERRHAAKPQQDEATIAAKAAEARKRFRARIEAHEAELRFKAEQAQQHEATKATLDQIRYKALAQKATQRLKTQAQTSVAPAAPLQQTAPPSPPSPVQPIAVIAAEPAVMALTSWNGPNILPVNAQTNLMGTAATGRSDVRMQFTEGVQSRPLMAGAFALPAAGGLGEAAGLLDWIPAAAARVLAPLAAPLAPALGGAAVFLGGPLARPAGGQKELEWERQTKLRQQQHGAQHRVAPMGSRLPTPHPTISQPNPAPATIAPFQSIPVPAAPVTLPQPIPQPVDPQLKKIEQDLKNQAAVEHRQQNAQKVLEALQTRLDTFNSGNSKKGEGFILNEELAADFLRGLLPQQQAKLKQAVESRYQKFADKAAQAKNPISAYERSDIQQKIQQQALYECYVPVREIYHFAGQFLNGFTPERMERVRGYFDQVFEDKYSKSIPAKKRTELIERADALYTQETGKSPNHSDPLWKNYRNVEASRGYTDLWDQFRNDISAAEGMSVHPTMTNVNNPDLGPRSLGRSQSQAPVLDLTKPQPFPTGEGPRKPQAVGGGFSNQVNPNLTKSHGFPTKLSVDGVQQVFKSQGKAPKGLINVVEEEPSRLGRVFARYDKKTGKETFAVRMEGKDGTEAAMSWIETGAVLQVADNLAEVQAAIGKNITHVKGKASDCIEEAIRDDRFSSELYAKTLSRRLGGIWKVEPIQNPGTGGEGEPKAQYEIEATRIGD